MTAIIKAEGIKKRYGRKQVLKNVALEIPGGRIVGVIGPNGAGKTTLLQALLGLKPVSGKIDVLGHKPFSDRARMLEQVCFMADTAILPGWMKVKDLLRYTQAVHPRFDMARARGFLADTKVRERDRVRELSKGMVTQLHLALVMAIDARVLVLDEPTLGLDLMYRKTFYDTLLNDYYDDEKTILITTHQVEEIEHILTDVVFIDEGEIALNESLESLQQRFIELKAAPGSVEAARALGPIAENRLLSGTRFIFEGVPENQLQALGETGLPALADIFVAKLGKPVAAGETDYE